MNFHGSTPHVQDFYQRLRISGIHGLHCKSYAKDLELKMKVFRDRTGTRKTLFLTMITTHGLKNGKNFPGLVHNEVSMGALFKS